MGTLRVHFKEIRSITPMRAKICFLAALSLAFNLAQVEAACNISDPCDCEHGQVFENSLKICGCMDDIVSYKENFEAPGCQLYQVEYEDIIDHGTSKSCKSNATGECRDAIHQYAQEYPDVCKESTADQPPNQRLTHGAWAIRMAENCPTSGSGKLTNWPLML